ncbi:DUF4105 domain-containing protein [Bdellovibrio sp. HCB337]|uniref:lipoprotein N-acyltransferase Lnb domain-containing protein n=1 Tax=Bdellovibrio sp. HCB337 TaxID=3394358 RepID=UPI0039A7715D
MTLAKPQMLLNLVLALSLTSSFAFAGDEIPATSECLARMQAGKYKGQCIDTSGKRAVKIIENRPEQMTINNFRKGGQFYKAVIPMQMVDSASYVIVDLNATPVNKWSIINISHTQLRFKMKPNAFIELYPINDTGGGPVLMEQDLFISMNYMAPKDVGYDPVKGFDEDLYASVLQIYSTADEIQTRFVKQKLNMYEIPLSINGTKAAQILRAAIKMSDRIQYSVPYDTWSSNCTTILFDIVDSGLELAKQKPYRFTPLMIRDTGLVPAFKQLAKRGVVDKETRVRLFNKEFGYDLLPSGSNPYFEPAIGKRLQDL